MTVVILPTGGERPADLYRKLRALADERGGGRDAVRTGSGGYIVTDELAYAHLHERLGSTAASGQPRADVAPPEAARSHSTDDDPDATPPRTPRKAAPAKATTTRKATREGKTR